MDKEIYTEMGQNEDKHWWFAGRREIIGSILDRFYSKSASNKVLEVGCGTGGNLALLSKYGKLAAVELFDDAVAIASKRNICPVYKGSLPDNLPFSDQYDLICMLDVLEHIKDDSASLSNLASQLNNRGMLLITVPAYMFLWSAHDEAHHHHKRYTLNELKGLIINSGLTVNYATYFNTLLFPIIYLIRQLGKLSKNHQASDANMPSPLVNQILHTIFKIEKYLLKIMHFPFGVSILIIAEKTG